MALEIHHGSQKSLPCREHFNAIHVAALQHDQKSFWVATAMVPCHIGARSSDTKVGPKMLDFEDSAGYLGGCLEYRLSI